MSPIRPVLLILAALLLGFIAAPLLATEYKCKVFHVDAPHDCDLSLHGRSGTYELDDGTTGTLRLTEWDESARQATYEWRDKYGRGDLIATFSTRHEKFTGHWRVPGSGTLHGSWTGQRH